jgi:hypothetical protein
MATSPLIGVANHYLKQSSSTTSLCCGQATTSTEGGGQLDHTFLIVITTANALEVSIEAKARAGGDRDSVASSSSYLLASPFPGLDSATVLTTDTEILVCSADRRTFAVYDLAPCFEAKAPPRLVGVGGINSGAEDEEADPSSSSSSSLFFAFLFRAHFLG